MTKEKDMKKVIFAAILALLLSTSVSAQVRTGVERYFKKAGYSLFYVQIVSSQGKDYLVVIDSDSALRQKYFTSDIPLMFDRLLFQSGFYFCKGAYLGGITELIDQDGEVQEFTFAHWQMAS